MKKSPLNDSCLDTHRDYISALKYIMGYHIRKDWIPEVVTRPTCGSIAGAIVSNYNHKESVSSVWRSNQPCSAFYNAVGEKARPSSEIRIGTNRFDGFMKDVGTQVYPLH